MPPTGILTYLPSAVIPYVSPVSVVNCLFKTILFFVVLVAVDSVVPAELEGVPSDVPTSISEPDVVDSPLSHSISYSSDSGL